MKGGGEGHIAHVECSFEVGVYACVCVSTPLPTALPTPLVARDKAKDSS